MQTTGSTSRDPVRALAGGLAIATAGALAAWVLAGAPPVVGFDDANIFLVYARNLASGAGAVWTPGGERVEGFTSALWTVIAALAYAVAGAGRVEVVLLIVSLLLTAIPIAVVLALLPRRGAGAWLSLVWILGLAGYFGWSGITLMDTALWAALLHLFLFALIDQARRPDAPRWRVPTLAALLVAARPEAMIVVPVLLAAAWLLAPGALRAWVGGGIAWALALAALTLFRLAYFGYPLPNTYYVKVPPDPVYRIGQGLDYLRAFALAHPTTACAAVAVTAWAVVAARRPGQVATRQLGAAWLASVLVAAGLLTTVLTGGDHFAAFRFLQPFLPAIALPLAAAADRLAFLRWDSGGRARAVRLALVALLVLWVADEWTTFKRAGLFPTAFATALQGRQVGATLNAAFPEAGAAPAVGVWQAGAVAYVYHGSARDLLGLNWVAMGHSPGDRVGIRAHAAFDADVFWAAPPELMLPTPLPLVQQIGCPVVIWEDILHGLVQSERFHDAYTPVLIGAAPDGAVLAYGRADWLAAGPRAVRVLGWEVCG